MHDTCLPAPLLLTGARVRISVRDMSACMSPAGQRQTADKQACRLFLCSGGRLSCSSSEKAKASKSFFQAFLAFSWIQHNVKFNRKKKVQGRGGAGRWGVIFAGGLKLPPASESHCGCGGPLTVHPHTPPAYRLIMTFGQFEETGRRAVVRSP